MKQNEDLRKLIPSAEQHERIIQGGEGETLGTTGRQRQAYNWETQRTSAGAKGPIRSFGQVTATPSGINIQSKNVYDLLDPHHENIAKQIEAARQAASEAEVAHANALRNSSAAQRVLQELSSAIPTQSTLSKAAQGALTGAKSFASNLGSMFGVIPVVNYGLGAAGTGLEGQEAYNRLQRARRGEGSYTDAILPAIASVATGIGTLSRDPRTKGIGLGIGAGASGLDYLIHRK